MSNKTEHIFQAGDVLKRNKGTLKILSQCYKVNNSVQKNKAYEYECLDCGNRDVIIENNLKRGNGCNCCAGNKIVKGINDMWTTNPEMAKMLKNPKDGYSLMKASNKKVDWICPICGETILQRKPSQIYRDGHISCPRCSDGISYANKFMYAFLKEIKIKAEREPHFDWLPNRPFDFVVEDLKLIIEMDGCLGHGVRDYKGNKDIEGQKIDLLKEQKAYENGYQVIRIDCKYKEVDNRFDYIKNNVINSKLISILNLDVKTIDWLSISRGSENSYVYIACELYNNGMKRTKEIANYLDLTSATIISYLKRGTKYGWCAYDPKNTERISSKGIPKVYNRGDKVLQIDITTSMIINEYDCLSDVDKVDGFRSSNVSNCCRGRTKQARGFLWMFKKSYSEELLKERINNIKRINYKCCIKQFRLDGTLVKEYLSIKDAERETGILNTGISKCCKKGNGQYCGFMWRYSDEVGDKIEPYVYPTSRPVLKISPETGEILKKYSSVKEAASKCNTSPCHISSVCKGKRLTAGGYIWKYEDDYKNIEIVSVKRPYESLGRAVCQYDKDMNLLNIFKSLKIAEDTTGIKKTNIWNCCKMLSKTAGGYIWRYADEVDNIKSA